MKFNNANILVINTGGTITMTDNQNGEQPPSPEESLNALIRTLSKDLDAEFTVKPLTLEDGTILDIKDSSSIGPDHWDAIAGMILRDSASYSGFVVVHGTDTMAYSASAVSYCTHAINKPVIFTGAQVPLNTPGSDGLQNLYLSLFTAAESNKSLPPLNEVMICFAGKLLRGNRSRKSSTRSAIGFTTPNAPILGELFPIPRVFEEQLISLQPNEYLLNLNNCGFSNNVLNMNLTPGINRKLLTNTLMADGLEGAVLRVFGTGTAPETLNLAGVIDDVNLQSNGHFRGAIIVTDVFAGKIDLQRYAASKTLRSPLIYDGGDMTPEAATTKFMWILGSEKRQQLLDKLMTSPVCGEVTPGTKNLC